MIPTGAMGNIVGGYMTKKMGVPIGKLCAGTNINDILFRAVETGKFHKSETMERTLSEAINIQMVRFGSKVCLMLAWILLLLLTLSQSPLYVFTHILQPYNFERLLYYLTDCSDELVKEWMETIDETSKLDLDATWLSRFQNEFSAARVTDNEMCDTARMIKDEYDYVVDPHTTVAVAAAMKLGYSLSEPQDDDSPVAILSTASPCKFEESMTVALGKDGWNEYVETKFPASALEVLEKTEVEPVLYRKGQDWEALARDIINELGELQPN